MAVFRRLCAHVIHRNHNVADGARVHVGVKFFAQQPFARPRRFALGIIHRRERKHVGGSVLAPLLAVDGADLVVVHHADEHGQRQRHAFRFLRGL